MKKVFLSLLVLIYMAVSSGMAMEIHYCMGERTGADFYSSASDKCGRCGMKEKKGGCCSDEQKFIKLSEDHKTSSVQYFSSLDFYLPGPAIEYYVNTIANHYKASFRLQTFEDSGPPLYIINRVFRI